jgi:hypothetical protein
MSEGQIAVFMTPFISQELGFGGESYSSSERIVDGQELQTLCNNVILSSLTTSWVRTRSKNIAKPDVLGLACGWILVQWLEWSMVTPEAFNASH